ncbi:MAG TPA: TRAP transporter small permease [Candidatus Salinicoccus stercoripullorum]|uniref:TRAP transporter small permease n=1 Tax=Candidatus Salinicoccus stercoripullorum TaxID=2838756 RepID=A0A9D1TZS4_9STAP|nr:TRAP transporter small permease [Candidatus Salinicoccus stercoripullorum]
MKLIRWFDEHFEEYILIMLSFFTVVVIFIQVMMRYVFSSSLSWSEEIARYGFIWMIFIGVSYAVKKNKHLKVDAITMLFNDKGKTIIGIIANVLFLVFAVVITYYSFEIVGRITRESAALQIPMSWVYAAPAAGMALTVIRLIQNLVQQYSSLKKLKGVENTGSMRGGTS